MKVIKRNGSEQPFNQEKIEGAVLSCLEELAWPSPLSLSREISLAVTEQCEALNRQIGVEEIQDMVETALMKNGLYEPAKRYIRYRQIHEIKRNTTDDKLMTLISGNNEEAIQENANKNPMLASTMRDYMAGEVSKDLTKRFLLPEDIWEAHEEGVIHFHDADYFSQPIFNCCLCNLEDMLQNGTVISGTMIEKPHTFQTACTITSQIACAVSSGQYGGQTISLSHISPFVEETRKKYRSLGFDEDTVERLTRLNIKDGVQTLNYQFQTLMTTNGQAPFITVFMDLGEVPEGKEREDLALVVEEVLNQRIAGIKNEQGIPVTQAFPKLIWLLDEYNINPNSKYYYLTELAAKCTAKRMVPDYISAKVMRKLKGDVYSCMG